MYKLLQRPNGAAQLNEKLFVSRRQYRMNIIIEKRIIFSASQLQIIKSYNNKFDVIFYAQETEQRLCGNSAFSLPSRILHAAYELSSVAIKTLHSVMVCFVRKNGVKKCFKTFQWDESKNIKYSNCIYVSFISYSLILEYE